ncbi:hypothetical protein [Thalassoroseus pseudoceratinae]|uniref:hypothetical protein n=1 Tax=Thalassoroseus pseudoceratinae TaxID=2713176 RepID=UPI00141F4BB6|nr:hypothetical protein [Thalassoroseus pseudoceratinae]
MCGILRTISLVSACLTCSVALGISGCASDGDPVLNTSMMPTKLLGGLPPQDEPDLGNVYGELPDQRESARDTDFDD